MPAERRFETADAVKPAPELRGEGVDAELAKQLRHAERNQPEPTEGARHEDKGRTDVVKDD